MQVNPLPWPHLLDANVTTVVMQTSDSKTPYTDQLLLANQPDAERLAIQNAVPQRQLEFARGRHCLRHALQLLGHTNAIIPVGSARQPILPPGTLGSISHCADYVVAACARQGALIGIGIDVEKHQPLAPDIQHLILTDREQQHIKQLNVKQFDDKQSTEQHIQAADFFSIVCQWEALIFSIKESFYKALFAVHPFYVDFLQAEVDILDAKTFQIQPSVELSQLGQKSHIGHYAWDSHYIYSGICITQS